MPIDFHRSTFRDHIINAVGIALIGFLLFALLVRLHTVPIPDLRLMGQIGKLVLRICRTKGIKSTIKHSYTRQASDPQYLAENILKREFYASKPNEKWLTDVTEFKYYIGA